jgi:hypothetical protein
MIKKTIFATTILCTIIIAIILTNIDGYSLTYFKNYLRKNYSELFHSIKSFIITKDQDYTLFTESLNLKIFRLILSKRDINHFMSLHNKLENDDNGLNYYAKNNVWRKARLVYNEKEYKIKIKSHGRQPSFHRNGFNISYSIKLRGNRQIKSVKRFNLIVRDHIQPFKFMTYSVADDFNLLTKKEELVRVATNNWEPKTYYFDFRMNNQYMEAIGKSSYLRYGYSLNKTSSTNKTFLIDSWDYNKELYDKTFYKTFSKLKLNKDFTGTYYNIFNNLNSGMAKKDIDLVSSFFDFDYITSFLAANSILGHGNHFAFKTNFYMFYNTADGKLYPVFTRDANIQSVMQDSHYILEKQLTENSIPLFNILLQNNRIRAEKYRKIYEYINTHNPSQYDQILEYYNSLSYFGQFKNVLTYYGLLDENLLINNFNVWRQYLENKSIVSENNIYDNKLVIKVSGIPSSGIKIKDIKAKYRINKFTIYSEHSNKIKKIIQTSNINNNSYLNNFTMMPYIDNNLIEHKVNYYIEITFNKVHDNLVINDLIDIRYINASTNYEIVNTTKYNEYLKLRIHDDDYRSVSDNIIQQVLEKNKLVYALSEDNLIVKKGIYYLQDDLVLKRHQKLSLEAGVELYLGEDVTIVSNDGIDILGTKEDNVIIASINNDKPFGSIGVLGGKDSTSNINYLVLSNGSERWINNVHFSGGLSIHYNKQVNITNTTIKYNNADDGLNIKYSKELNIRNSLFESNYSDQIDLDYCNGTIEDSRFVYKVKKTNNNGDGLDISGSIIVANNNKYKYFPDKGISVGENSLIYINSNSFIGNNSGVAVKDFSKAYLVHNKFYNNTTDLGLYQKKQIFGGGIAYVDDRNMKVTKDDNSMVEFHNTTYITDKYRKDTR